MQSYFKFGHEELAVLQAAFDRACTLLALSPSDSDARDGVAKAIMALAHSGQDDQDKLIAYAVADYEKQIKRTFFADRPNATPNHPASPSP